MATASLRDLRQRRERAEDWIAYASWTAIGTAGLGVVFSLVILLDSPLSEWAEVIPFFTGFVAQGLVGYKLRTRSQWAAWGLMASYIATFAVSLVMYGAWSGIILKVGIAAVYVRGFVATLDYEELSKQIAAAGATVPGDAA